MPVITDIRLLAENPEAAGEWVGYPDTVALPAGEPFRCRLCYRHESEEPGGFTGIEIEALFADENHLISHFVPESLPPRAKYSTEKTADGYRLQFKLEEPFSEKTEGEFVFFLESRKGEVPDETALPTAVALSGLFRGAEGDESIGMEKPGPVWMILSSVPKAREQSCETPCRYEECSTEYCPKIVKLAPPGDFWRPQIPKGEKKQERGYRTIRVTPRPKPKHFYW